MRANSNFLKADSTHAWLAQFAPADQRTAVELLREIQLVSRNAFVERLRGLILQLLDSGEQPVALYAEREIHTRLGKPDRLFKETTGKIKRARGVGPTPVKPTRSYDPKVGSEGIVAQLVSELCREFSGRLIDHPGPDKIRKLKVRRFMLVTDFIGSGRRAKRYLDAAWRVRSVRSWWSLRSTKGLSFEVVAYSATPDGTDVVKAHPSAPEIHAVTVCPTIRHITANGRRERLKRLCLTYDPKKGNRQGALGFEETGALIAFAHGAPNNAPRLLQTSTENWAALFPKRITSATRHTFDAKESDADEVRSRLEGMRQTRLAQGDWIEGTRPGARLHLTVLAALAHSPRTDEALLHKTGLSIIDIQNALATALANGWIGDSRHLTDRGRAELANARKAGRRKESIPEEPVELYYPKSLRAPSGVSS